MRSIRILVLVLLPWLSACSTSAYYWQALNGQLSLLRAREPVQDWLAAPDTDAELRRRLRLSQDALRFAHETLRLPDNGSYRSYVDWPAPYLVWNLVAAPALSLSPRQWCFPFLGCVAYRGYFDEAAARAQAEALAAQGWDVAVGGVAAYSTLGWFEDPLISTMMHWSDDALVELIFHELAHQKLYLRGDSAFNEAYATAVAAIGLEQWIAARGDPQLAQAMAQRHGRQADFRALVSVHRAALARVYSSDQPDAIKQTLKAAELQRLREAYADLKQAWGGYAGYDQWMAQANNARLSLLATYHQRVPGFRALFAAHDADWAAFHAAAQALSQQTAEQREAVLRAGSVEAAP